MLSVASVQEPSLYLVLASALTNIHVGAGRSPGVVDLPVVRDPLGVFYIPGSSLKGSLKSTAATIKKCIKDDKIDCRKNNDCKKLCCFLGGEVGESNEAPSMLSVGDLYPLLIPVPSLSHGFVYVSSPMLIARAKSIQEAFSASGSVAEKLLYALERGVQNLRIGEAVILDSKSGDVHEASVGTTVLKARKVNVNLNEAEKELGSLSSIYSMHPLEGNTIIVSDELMPVLIERALVRLTRIRLDRLKKTVVSGALWTEEYIPQFTLFMGYIANTGHRGKEYCNSIRLENPVREFLDILAPGGNADNKARYVSIVIGGKESVGKGLLRLRVCLANENTSSM